MCVEESVGMRTPWGPEGPAASPQAGHTFLTFWPPKGPGRQCGALPCRYQAACLTGVGRIHVFLHGNFIMKLCVVNS